MREMTNRKRNTFVFLLGLLAIACLFGWKIHYGNADIDEAFYPTVPFRLLKGDALLQDEWHVTQLSGFLLVPFMALQRFLFGGTEGMILHFRVFWLMEHLMVMILSYWLLQRRHDMSAIAAAWMYGLFVPFGMMALSYNSMGVDAAYLLAVLYFTGSKSAAADIGKGFLFAVMVLCCPYTLGIYLLFVLMALIHRVAPFDEQLDIGHMLRMHLGILILLIPFVVHVVSGMESVGQVIDNLRQILSDPAHAAKSFFGHSRFSMNMLIRENNLFFVRYAVLLAVGLVIRKLRPVMTGLIALACTYYLVRDVRYFMYYWDGNSMAMFFLFAGIAVFLYDRERSLRTLLYTILLPIGFALCVNMASNQAVRSMNVAFLPGSCLAMVSLGDYCSRNPMNLKIRRYTVPVLKAMILLALGMALAAHGYLRLNHVFWEYVKPAELTAQMDHGAFKGIYTTPEKKAHYDMLCQELESLGDLRDQNVLFFPTVPSGYLIADCEIGAPSGWMEFSSLRDSRLETYYDMHPEKQPDFIVVDNTAFIGTTVFEKWTTEDYWQYADEHGYKILVNNETFMIMSRK